MKVNRLRMLYKWSALLVLLDVALVVYDHFWNDNALQAPLLVMLAILFLTVTLLLLIKVADPNPQQRRGRGTSESTVYGDP